MQAALARDPKNNAMKGELIRVEAEIGGMRAAWQRRMPLREDPETALRHSFAELYEKAGRRDEAVDLLERAVANRRLGGEPRLRRALRRQRE